MHQFSQKYTIIQLLEDLPEGFEYDWKNWPLHITIADVFAIDWSVDTLTTKLKETLSNQSPFTASVLNDEFFGPNREVRVTLINKTAELTQLHLQVVQLLEEGSVVFNNPHYNGDGFLPHSTVQSHMRLHQGDIVTFNALSIVDMFPDNDPYRRKIIKTIPFATKNSK